MSPRSYPVFSKENQRERPLPSLYQMKINGPRTTPISQINIDHRMQTIPISRNTVSGIIVVADDLLQGKQRHGSQRALSPSYTSRAKVLKFSRMFRLLAH